MWFGVPCYRLMLLLALLRLCDPRSGYGGALSVYFGLSAGLQQLHVSHISLGLRNNVLESCVVSVSVSGGNAYGGAVSIYMGAYSSRLNFSGDAAAAAGDTVVRNVSLTLDTARFASCSARREINGFGNGSNVYGGSFSFYIGAYAWSRSHASSSSSTCGATDVIGVDVRVQHATSVDCTAITHVSLLRKSPQSLGANSYGGAMSALYVGAYSWSRSFDATTTTTTTTATSSSKCGATSVSGVSVQVSDSGCSNCSAVSSSVGESRGANSYGGAMSALYVGAYSWSLSITASSSSTCGATSVSGVSVQVSDSGCFNCSAVSSTMGASRGANSYGGAMSVLYVGAYSLSRSGIDSSSSKCEATSVSRVSVQVSDSGCSNCSAVSSSNNESYGGANSYGGAMSVLYVGAYSSSSSNGVVQKSCTAFVTNTHVDLLSITIKRSGFQNSKALSSECYLFILNAKDLTRFEVSETGPDSEGANVSSSAATLPFSRAIPHRGGVSRFAGLRRRNQRHGWAFCSVVYGNWKLFCIMRRRHLRQVRSSHRWRVNTKQPRTVQHLRYSRCAVAVRFCDEPSEMCCLIVL
jgi:hypothetical protein